MDVQSLTGDDLDAFLRRCAAGEVEAVIAHTRYLATTGWQAPPGYAKILLDEYDKAREQVAIGPDPRPEPHA